MTLNDKLIIYDSQCKVCTSLKDLVSSFTSIPKEQIRAYQALPQAYLAQVDPDQFKNGMALVDSHGGETIYGAAGIAFIFSAQYRLVRFVLQFSFFYTCFVFLYKVLAYNRYIIALPKSKFECDCFPDRVAKYRVAYILIVCLSSVFLMGCVGISLRHSMGSVSVWKAAYEVMVLFIVGWFIQFLLALVFLKDQALDYIGHLASIMMVGVLVWLPWICFYFISGIISVYIPLISVIVSFGYMFYLHNYRANRLGLSFWWTMSWTLLIGGGEMYFYFRYLVLQ